MCLIFTCGEHTFRKEVEGYEGIICRCYNCGNQSGRVIKSHPWFTFCFIPIIPLSMHGYQDVTCHICNFAQPLEHRQDVQAMRRGEHGGGGGGGQGPPQHPPQASPPPQQQQYYGSPPPQQQQQYYGTPPPQQQQQQYFNQGQPPQQQYYNQGQPNQNQPMRYG